MQRQRLSRLVPVFLASMILTGAAMSDEKKGDENKSRDKLLKAFASELVDITPGKGKFPKSFQMGSKSGDASEAPVHTVTFDYSFSMAKYEVPQDLYTAVMGKNPSVWGGPRNSTEMMNFNESIVFCRRITGMLRSIGLIEDTEEIRLPTEAEWEYCCRAGSSTAYSFGDSATAEGDAGKKASKLDPFGWHTGNAAGNDPPVGALKPNAFGLYDFHGYLWEFVSDDWHANYDGAPKDGSARTGSPMQPRIIRGGSWREHHSLLKSTTRWAIPDHVRSDAIGFRCVKAKR